jgi:hypothetical protein
MSGTSRQQCTERVSLCSPLSFCKGSGLLCLTVARASRNEENNFIFWPGYGTKGDVWSEQLENISVSFQGGYCKDADVGYI